MPSYRIKHITHYSYPSPVIDSANQVMLFPIQDESQEIRRHELEISTDPSVELFNDYFGNKMGVFSIVRPHQELTITSWIEVITHETKLPIDNHPVAAQWMELDKLANELPHLDFLQLEQGERYEEILGEVQKLKPKSTTPFQLSKSLMEFIYENFEYKKGITNVETEVDEIWKLKAGVCQDFAHLMLAMLRMSGIPARYVSGYICPKNHELRGEGATHAWVDAFIPFHGWIGLDPTNNCIASDRHVRLAVGRYFSDCTPVKGTYRGSSEHTLEVSVQIENGEYKTKPDTSEPVFTYQVKNPAVSENSYRKFMEMQQQQ